MKFGLGLTLCCFRIGEAGAVLRGERDMPGLDILRPFTCDLRLMQPDFLRLVKINMAVHQELHTKLFSKSASLG